MRIRLNITQRHIDWAIIILIATDIVVSVPRFISWLGA